ncbi:MAG TPA: LON peptidase substrate-binding domain-containing protein, partial [Bryobacteraceae bacterium]|nr:LON peptidase substrate-binding domain-containing protein [Bryobacteraceae bacterium]
MPVDEAVEDQAPAADLPQAGEELPILTVRDTTLFPHAMLPITVGRPASLALVQSLGENRLMGVVSQLDPRVEQPDPDDLYEVGTVAIVHKVIQVPKESLLLFCEGLGRIRTLEYTSTEPYLKARVERIPEIEPEKTPELEALRQNVVGLFQQVVSVTPNLSDDLSAMAQHIAELGRLADFIAGTLPGLSHPERQVLLEQEDAVTRLREVHKHLTRETELLELRGKIQSEVKGQISQSQREFYLREQLKAIQKELGEGDETQRDIQDLREKLEAAGMSEEVRKEALKELDRLARISPMS